MAASSSSVRALSSLRTALHWKPRSRPTHCCCGAPSRPSSSGTFASSSFRGSLGPHSSAASLRSFSSSSLNQSSWPAESPRDREDESLEREERRSQHELRMNASTRTRAGPSLEHEPSSAERSHSSKIKAEEGSNSAEKQPAAFPGGTSLPPPPRQKTIMYLNNMKKQGTPIAVLTATDFPSALSIRSADVDICLVGDSLANVALGYSTTQHVTLQEMIYACQAVHRGISSPVLSAVSRTAAPFMIADLPFGTFYTSVEEGTRSAIRLIQEGKVEAVKIEGGEEVVPLIRNLTRFGIPVMGHIGLQPQKVASTSGYRVQGRTAAEAKEIFDQALLLQDAGVFGMVLECVPSKLASYITQRLDVITIGIGAGSSTDGQVLVMSDMLGDTTSPAHVLAGLDGAQAESPSAVYLPRPHPNTPLPPKFVRIFTPSGTTVGAMRQAAVKTYVDAVRSRDFPSEVSSSEAVAAGSPRASESYKMKKEEWQGFLQLVEGSS